MKRILCLVSILVLLALVPLTAIAADSKNLTPLFLSAADATAAEWMSSKDTRALFCATALIDVLLNNELNNDDSFEMSDIQFSWGAYIARSGLDIIALLPVKGKGLLTVIYTPFTEKGVYGLVEISLGSETIFNTIAKQVLKDNSSSYYQVDSEDLLDVLVEIAGVLK